MIEYATNDLYKLHLYPKNYPKTRIIWADTRSIRTTTPGVSGCMAGVFGQKPVVPISAGDAQLGAQRPEQKKEGLGEVEGNAVMLTCRENGLSCHISI